MHALGTHYKYLNKRNNINILSKEHVNLIFKNGQTLHALIFNGKYKNNDGRKKALIYKIPCNACKLCYIGETVLWYHERKKQH